MKQIITLVDEDLEEAVKEHATLTGVSVNTYITRLLINAVEDRQPWKRKAISTGLLSSRTAQPAPHLATTVTTAPGYAAELVSAERDDW